jgi:glutathione S-transferase
VTVKLHRCGTMWFKGSLHPCWRVQRALDEQGISYELVRHPALPWRRKEYIALTGQRLLPAIELEDGRVIREESKDLAARVRYGRLNA